MLLFCIYLRNISSKKGHSFVQKRTQQYSYNIKWSTIQKFKKWKDLKNFKNFKKITF